MQGIRLKNAGLKSKIGRVVLAGVFGLVLSVEHGYGQSLKLTAEQIRGAGIQTTKPESVPDSVEELKLSGYFSHARLGALAVSSLEAATVMEVLKDNLSHVKAGEPLLRLSSEAWFRYQQEHVQNRTALSLARQAATRDQSLFDEGLIPQRRLLDTQAQLTMTQASYQSSRQRLKLMGAGEGQIKQLESSGNLQPSLVLLAPIAGNLSGLDLTAGKHVEAGSTLFQIVKPGALELVLSASPTLAAQIKAGLLVNLKDCTGHISPIGKILGVGGQLSEGSQTVPIRVGLISKPQSLECFKVNQFTEASVQMASAQKQMGNQYKVPSQAIITVGKKIYVFAKSPNGFEAIEVQSKALSANSVAIWEAVQAESKGQVRLSSSSELAVSGTVLLKGAMQGLGAE